MRNKMNDMQKYSKEFMCEFIELYKSLPSLWKIKSKEYSNRDLKSRDYQILINKWKEVEPTADREFVIKKINNIRSVYRRERKRIQKERLEMGESEVPSSSFSYYSLLDFLKDQETPKPSTSNFAGYEEQMDCFKDEATFAPFDPFSFVQQNLSLPAESKKRRRQQNTDSILNEIYTLLKEPITYDKHDYAAKAWAEILRGLPQQQQIFASKLINDVLYEAQLQTLSRDSYIEAGNRVTSQAASFTHIKPE